MGMHDDRLRAMRYEHPEAIPVSISILPAAWKRHREAMDEIAADHPLLFGQVTPGQRDYDAVSGLYVSGCQTDAWGCIWTNIAEGFDSFVTGHPIPTREALRSYQAPAPGAGMPHGFMWLRLEYLRGFEELMCDFGEEPPELQQLLDLVLEYNLNEVDAHIRGAQDLAYFGDDLGMQTALPISPTKWRKYLKPCFQAIYDKVHAAGLSVYMHTDGHLIPIVDDLIDCGVNVLNPQFRANGLDNLVATCKGKLCLNLDLDRQMFPFCGPADIDAHVREAVAALGAPEGGLWVSAEIGPEVPLPNVRAMCEALERYRGYYS